jgi:putative ABC transport system ATP-binding protein
VSGATPLIRFDRVYKIYRLADAGVAALGGVSLDVSAGTFVAILGPSGAGKSTILNLIGAVETPTAGLVSVDGHDLARMTRGERSEYRRRTVGFLWQGATRNLVPYLSASRNVSLPVVLAGGSNAQGRRRAAELMEFFGLSDRAALFPFMLSGGEQQLVAVAVALANRPSIVLADEPTAEVDTVAGERVIRALRGACREFGATALMATHDLVAATQADVTHRLIDGRIRGMASPARIEPGGRIMVPERVARAVGESEAEVEVEGSELRIRPVPAAVAGGPVRDVAQGGAPQRAPSFLGPAPRRTAQGRAGPERTPLLSAEGLTRIYPGPSETTALRDVSLTLTAGRVVVLIGPSGSGKSTLVGLLAGLDEPDDGTVSWQGRRIHEIPGAERARIRATHMGVVFQALGLLPSLSPRENVMLPLLMGGQPASAASVTAERWLEHLGLGERLNHRLNELSAGQRQRVAVARALAPGPRLVLADEPTAEVDGTGAEAILGALREVAEQGGAVLVASHDPRALRQADWVLVLRDGHVEAEGRPDDIALNVTTE